MSKGIVTEYPEICIFCGRQAEAEHHLIFGTAGRELSERDGLKIQAIWEKEWITANSQQEPRKAREAFRKRYGRSYL